MQVLAKLDNALLAVLRAGVALTMAVTTVCVILQVYFRYVLNAPLAWSEELARYSMIWGAFLGGPLAIRNGMNVGITLVTDRLPAGMQRAALILNSILVIVFLAGLARYGHEFATMFSFQRSPVMRAPMNLIYIAIPISAALGILQTIIVTVQQLRSWPAGADAGETRPN